MENQFGTWKVEEVDLSKNKFDVVPIFDEYGNRALFEDKICTIKSSRADAKKNAKLIAAAPELLDALNYLLQNEDVLNLIKKTFLYTKATQAITKATK